MTQYHPVVVSTRGRVSQVWLAPCGTIGEASRAGQAEIDAGRATLAFVVRDDGTTRDIEHRATRPASASKIIRHLLDLEDELDKRDQGGS